MSLLLPAGTLRSVRDEQNVPAPPSTSYEVAWEKRIQAEHAPHLAIVPPRVLVATESSVAAYGVDDGAEAWPATPLAVSLMTAGDSHLFVASGEQLLAIDAASGTREWSVPAADATSLTWHGGRLIATTGADLRAWDARGGEAWRRDLGAPAVAPPAAAEGVLIVLLPDRSLVALDEASGAVRWKKTLPAAPRAVAMAAGRVYVTADDQTLRAYDLAGDEKWAYPLRVEAIGSPAADGRCAYLTLLDNTLRAFRRGNGNRCWLHELDQRPAQGPISLTDSLLIAMSSGELVLVPSRNPARAAMAAPRPASRVALERVAVARDGRHLASAAITAGGARTLTVFRRGQPEGAGSAKRRYWVAYAASVVSDRY